MGDFVAYKVSHDPKYTLRIAFLTSDERTLNRCGELRLKVQITETENNGGSGYRLDGYSDKWFDSLPLLVDFYKGYAKHRLLRPYLLSDLDRPRSDSGSELPPPPDSEPIKTTSIDTVSYTHLRAHET